MELERGGVLKGTLEPGEGHASPQLGDLVFLLYTLIDAKEKIVESSREECGGPGHPRPFILGKDGKRSRPLRGMELALKDMRLQERCGLQLKAEFAFAHKECTWQPPEGLKKDDFVAVDVQLVSFSSGHSVRSIGEAGLVLTTLKEGAGWETPRAPFDVTLRLTGRTVAAAGQRQQGEIYFPAANAAATAVAAAFEKSSIDSIDSVVEIRCSMGDGSLPPGLETTVQEMHRGEEIVVLMPASLAENGTSVPPPPFIPDSDILYPSVRYVEFTVTLVDFLQVRDISGDGAAMKRTLRKGNGEFPVDCPLDDTAVHAAVRVRSFQGTGEWIPLPGSEDSKGSIRIDTGMGAVPVPVEAALRLMLKNEISLVRSTWQYAIEGWWRDAKDAVLPFGNDGGDITPGCDVEFEIELIEFEALPNLAMASLDEKLERAAKWKEQGNMLFKSGKYGLARVKYTKGLRGVDRALGLETEEQVVVARAVKMACLVNLAACAQKEKEYGEVITWCDRAIG